MRVTLGLLVSDAWARLVHMTDKRLAYSPTRYRHFFITYRVHACIFFNESPCIMDTGKELFISRWWSYIGLPSSSVLVGRSIIFATRANSSDARVQLGLDIYVSPVALRPIGFKIVEWRKDLSMTHVHALYMCTNLAWVGKTMHACTHE
jgi:hypothetical protein